MAGLTFGPLDLMGEDSDFELVALSTDEGTSWGNPDTVDVELRSFLQHGALVETENWTNRTLVIAVSVGGDTNDDVARNEKTLVTQLHRRNLLSYTPETATVATVFPVLTSTLEPTHDDFRESFHHEVIYQIRMTCTPFVRSSELRFVDAVIPGDPAGDVVATTVDGTSSGWTAFFAMGGDTPHTDTITYGAEGVTLSATGSIPWAPDSAFPAQFSKGFGAGLNTSGHDRLFVDWKTSNPGLYNGTALALSGGYLAHAGDIASPDFPGYTRSYFTIPASLDLMTAVLLQFYFNQSVFFTPYPTVTIRRVGLSNSVPSLSTRQLVRSLAIDGVMPTTGSIAVASTDASALREVLIYTRPRQDAGLYLPPCRSYLIDTGGTVVDASAASGARTDITAAFRQFHIPSTKLPEAEYLLAVRANMAAKNPAGRSINIRTSVDFRTFSQPPRDYGNIDTSHLYDDAVGGYQFMSLLTLSLPPTRMALADDAYTVIDIRAAAGTGTAYLDDLYLFDITHGELTHVDAGTCTRLWIDSPDITNDGQPGLWIGNQADRSDQVSAFPAAKALDIHQFDPIKGVNVTSIVTGPSEPVAVSFAYYDQYWYRVPPADDADDEGT